MTAYNAAMGLARKGLLDAGRVRRGLGLAQSKRELPYRATPFSCHCKDSLYRDANCKHRIAANLRELAVAS